jgi:hypothetical protein
MDLIRNYPEFEQDITDAFKDVISKFKFKLTEIDKGLWELNNGKITIMFSFDRGDIFCFIRKLDDIRNRTYLLMSVYRFLYKNDTLDISWKEAKVQLKNLAIIADTKLNEVLLGDFSWVDSFEKEQNKLSKKIQYVSNKMDKNHPIYIKFEDDDSSWFDDLEKYITENNIELN